MVYKISIILLVILKIHTIEGGHGFSRVTGSTPMNYIHGVLTPYENVGSYDASEIHFPGCEAQKMWIFARHGSRYPFDTTMRKIWSFLPDIQRKIKGRAHRNIKLWRPLFKPTDQGKLMRRGKEELLQLGERFRLRFPSLITQECDNNMYKYKSTNTHRTKQSAKQFGIGLLGENYYGQCWHHDPTNKNRVLEFYNYCEKWNKNIRRNSEVRHEERQFTQSEHVVKMLRDVSKRLGYKADYHDVSLIQEVCAYESAFHEDETTSPWCNLLLPEEFAIVEYMNDLYSYWVHGYGYSLTYQQACPMLVDMFQFFDSEDGEKIMAYFGHDTGMWKIIALLGIHKDEHPLRGNSYIQFKNRKWRSTFVSPFAANIAFVSYQCGESKTPSILFLHQERIVSLPGCPAHGPCPIDIMKRLYASTDEQCRFEELCAV